MKKQEESGDKKKGWSCSQRKINFVNFTSPKCLLRISISRLLHPPTLSTLVFNSQKTDWRCQLRQKKRFFVEPHCDVIQQYIYHEMKSYNASWSNCKNKVFSRIFHPDLKISYKLDSFAGNLKYITGKVGLYMTKIRLFICHVQLQVNQLTTVHYKKIKLFYFQRNMRVWYLKERLDKF